MYFYLVFIPIEVLEHLFWNVNHLIWNASFRLVNADPYIFCSTEIQLVVRRVLVISQTLFTRCFHMTLIFLIFQLISGSDCLDGFFRSMSAIEAPSIISAIHLSMKRLLDSLPHTDLARTLLKMISLLNEKNITMEMLVSMAEVALSPVYSSQMVCITLQQRLINFSK